MYVPTAFAQPDRAAIFNLLRAHSFAVLVSQLDGRPFATHLPLLIRDDAPPEGQLTGHLARANPQWRELAGQEVLAVFSGPHAYVSPTWYEEPDVVPTWNYVAAHVYGRCELIDDAGELLGVLADYVSTYERASPNSWQFDPASPYIQKLAQAVVGFRIVITRLEAKWKLGQNHPPQRRENAARYLAASDDAESRQIASLMGATIPD